MYDYEAIKQKIATERPLDKSVEGLIKLDVHRSFQSSKAIRPDALINILNVHAYCNCDVQYCQGMNFLAGYLYLLHGNEADSFKFMKCLIDRYEMQNLFTQDVPLLKQYFYELDRLLYFTYPDLSAYFRSEGVSTSFFASAWFMTVFSYCMQHATEDKPTEMMLAIWDAFLVDGWKAVFKAALFIIGELREKLLDSKFDQIMAQFGEVPKGKLLHDPETATRFRAAYGRLKVTNSILANLGREYLQTYEKLRSDVGEVIKESP